jgi:hypothetical protein
VIQYSKYPDRDIEMTLVPAIQPCIELGTRQEASAQGTAPHPAITIVRRAPSNREERPAVRILGLGQW